MLPIRPGLPARQAHDYRRNGMTAPFAARDTLSGEVLQHCQSHHTHVEFIEFLKHVDRAVPKWLEAHIIMDNYAAHKHTARRAWLERHPRFHVHFTPTSPSWLNAVE